MLTERGAALVIVTASLATIGYLFDVWVAAAAALPLGMALIVSAVAFALSDPAPQVARLASPPRALIGDHPQITLRIRSRVTLGALEVLDVLPPGLERAHGANSGYVRVPGGDRGVTLVYDVDCRVRGHFLLDRLKWRWTSPFGAFAREGVSSAGTRLTVLPRWEEGEFGTIRPPKHVAIGLLQVAAAGQGSEFYGLREYASGDPYRSINWKATARRGGWSRGELLVNEFEREVPSDVVMLLDARLSAAAGDAAENPLEVAVRTIASLSHHYLAEGSRVGLVILNARPRYLHPERGSRQLDRILEELLEVRAEGDMPLAHLVAVVPPEPKATGIMFANTTRDPSLTDAAMGLSERYRRSLVITPLTRKESTNHPLGKEAMPGAVRIRDLEIDALRDSYAAAGIPVILWDAENPLAPILEGAPL